MDFSEKVNLISKDFANYNAGAQGYPVSTSGIGAPLQAPSVPAFDNYEIVKMAKDPNIKFVNKLTSGEFKIGDFLEHNGKPGLQFGDVVGTAAWLAGITGAALGARAIKRRITGEYQLPTD